MHMDADLIHMHIGYMIIQLLKPLADGKCKMKGQKSPKLQRKATRDSVSSIAKPQNDQAAEREIHC